VEYTDARKQQYTCMRFRRLDAHELGSESANARAEVPIDLLEEFEAKSPLLPQSVEASKSGDHHS
jgi:hypothetical protein